MCDSFITNKLIKEVNESVFFFLCDETSDLALTEQMSLSVKY